MMTNNKTCKDCVYYQEFRQHGFVCKRFPPQNQAAEIITKMWSNVINYEVAYPIIEHTEWCGEFKQKDS